MTILLETVQDENNTSTAENRSRSANQLDESITSAVSLPPPPKITKTSTPKKKDFTEDILELLQEGQFGHYLVIYFISFINKCLFYPICE